MYGNTKLSPAPLKSVAELHPGGRWLRWAVPVGEALTCMCLTVSYFQHLFRTEFEDGLIK